MKRCLILLGLAAFFSLSAEVPEPYSSVQDLPFDEQGWFNNQAPLEEIIAQIKPKTVIEVGSWLGASTRFFAERVTMGGKVYAVDTWKGSSDEEIHMKDPRLPYLYQLFLSNVKHAGLTETIIPVRMHSLEAAKALNVKADLIYIDAAHDPESVYQDILAWYPHLKAGGVICGDDWGWGFLKEGVKKAAEELDKKILTNGWFWRFD